MCIEDMLLICDKFDCVGYWLLEVWGGVIFDVCVCFFKEDLWECLCKFKVVLFNICLQMFLCGQNLFGYCYYSDDVVCVFVVKVVVNGIDVFCIFDVMNDVCNLCVFIEVVKVVGKYVQGIICYIISLVYIIEVFVVQGKVMVDMGVDFIVIKDMVGLFIFYVIGDLVKVLKDVLLLDVVVYFYDIVGVVSMCQFKVVENGVDCIDMVIFSMVWGISYLGIELMVVVLCGIFYDIGLDLELIQEIGMYFYVVCKKYYQFESEFIGVDICVQVNQVLGGMIFNLVNQFKEQGVLNCMGEVFEEILWVCVDFGFLLLVMLILQIVGIQVFFNVFVGECYKIIINEVKLYLQGCYGKVFGEVNE